MTDNRFEKLVNLYLDKEISPEELSDLKAEIAHNLVRRKTFERLCRVHSASRKALIDHSTNSGISKFLREDISVVESRRGKRTRVRAAGTEEEADKRARAVLWQGAVAFLTLIIVAGLVTAFLIDRTASSLQVRNAKDNQDDLALDLQAFKEQLGQLDRGEQFLLTAPVGSRNDGRTKLFILRWESTSTEFIRTSNETEPNGQWTLLELTEAPSPTEAHYIHTQQKSCAGQLPGTSAPAAIPEPPSSLPRVLIEGDYTLTELP